MAATIRSEGGRVLSPSGAYAMLLFVIVLWGINWPIMKIGLAYMPPFWFAFGRLLLGSFTLFAVLVARGDCIVPSRRDMPIVLTGGLVQLSGFLMFVHLGLMFVEAGRAAILAYTTPLWVAPGAVLFLGERLTRLKIVGLCVGILGLAILFNPAALDWSDGDVLIGNGFLLLAAIFWACAILHIRGHKYEATPLQLAPWQMLIACVPPLVVALAIEPMANIRWNGDMLIVLFYNGSIATAIGFWGLVMINRALPAITTSLAVLGVPAMGLISSVIWLDEALTLTLSAGLVLICGGLALVTLADRRAEKAPIPEQTPSD